VSAALAHMLRALLLVLRVAPCCPTRATARHNFSCGKMHGLDSVSWCVVTLWAKWNLGYRKLECLAMHPTLVGRRYLKLIR